MTYSCLLTFYETGSIPGTAAMFPGVRLRDLPEHLRRTVPSSKPETWSAEYLNTWPLELRLLRAMVEPEDCILTPALAQVPSYPLDYIGGSTNHTHLGVGPHQLAKAQFLQAANDRKSSGQSENSIIDESEHAVLMCVHATKFFGFQQWILFDDRWAAENQNLAASILRYASDWDPFPNGRGS